ncbi:3711_t:CDS:2, partial [Gigaspora rosea]
LFEDFLKNKELILWMLACYQNHLELAEGHDKKLTGIQIQDLRFKIDAYADNLMVGIASQAERFEEEETRKFKTVKENESSLY